MNTLTVKTTFCDNPDMNGEEVLPAERVAEMYPDFAGLILNPDFASLVWVVGPTKVHIGFHSTDMYDEPEPDPVISAAYYEDDLPY